MSAVALQMGDGIAMIRLSEAGGPRLPVKVRQGLWEALEIADAEPAVKAVVLLGIGHTSKHPGAIERGAPDIAALAGRLESVAKPVVVGLHGLVLGDAMALAVAGHYRLAEPDAQIGMPASEVGLPPRGGLSQRVARLSGAAGALRLLAQEAPMRAIEAERAGLIDGTVQGNLQATAHRLARDLVEAKARPKRSRDRADGLSDSVGFQRAIALARTGAKSIGLKRLIDCIEAAQILPFDQGLVYETEARDEALAQQSVHQLRHIARAERGLMPVPSGGAPLACLGVVGSGGAPGAQLMARALAAGLEVRLLEQDAGRIDAAREAVADIRDSEDGLERLVGVASVADLAPAEVLVETLPDDSALKGQLLAHLVAGLGPEGAVLTLSEAVPVARVTAGIAGAEKVAGMRLVAFGGGAGLAEVEGQGQVGGQGQGPALGPALGQAVALADALGLPALQTRGPVAGRLWSAAQSAAQAEVARGRATPATLAAGFSEAGFTAWPLGAAPEGPPAQVAQRSVMMAMANAGAGLLVEDLVDRAAQIDLVAVLGCGAPRAWGGPMFWADAQGLVDVLAELQALHKATGDQVFAPSPLIQELARQGLQLADWSP